MSAPPFSGIADFYDLVYAGKDTAAEATYVRQSLHRLGVADAAHLLEWGSGTGRHAAALSQLGYRVSGVERSPDMLARARMLLPQHAGLDFRQGDLLDIPMEGSSYDALIACFHVISYLTSEAELARAFVNAKRSLNHGGVFLFDVWHGPAVLAQRPETRCASYADTARELIRVAQPSHDPEQHRVDVHYRYFHRLLGSPEWRMEEETHRVRYWFVEEIQRIATTAGLRWLSAEEWLSGKPASDATWGVCHLLSA
jgi:SAM-dependent methyltransferase